jgi:hypothetical protein
MAAVKGDTLAWKESMFGPAGDLTYDFDGQGNGDLSFREGDRIRVVQKTNSTDDWWEGELSGGGGGFFFPMAAVKGDTLAWKESMFGPAGDLTTFREGDRIRVVQKTNSTDDWWEGELRGQKGPFPANYVE